MWPKTSPTDSRIGDCNIKRQEPCLPYESLWTGLTAIDTPAYMHDTIDGVETYQKRIVHLL